MLAVRESTHILSGFLEPDGSITVIVLLPDGGQPVSVTIAPTETTIRATGSTPRQIDLTFGAEADRHLRLIVAMHVDALACNHALPAAPPLGEWCREVHVSMGESVSSI